MSKRLSIEPEPSPRFIKRPETIATLAYANDVLTSLNDDYHTLSLDQNPRSASHPYEGAVLFTLDNRPTDRASAIAHAPAYGLEHTDRLDFTLDAVANRRIILSQTALGASLKEDRTPSFRSSHMNPTRQMVWAHPLVVDAADTPTHAVGAIQLGYTVNEHPGWVYPGNDEVEQIWRSHRRSIDELGRELAQLAKKTDSLTKSLEIAPPITDDHIVIQWDGRNSTRNVLSDEYPVFDAYLEAWKKKRQEITEPYGAKILDRGDGEFIIIPLAGKIDIHNTVEKTVYSKREIPALIAKLTTEHDKIARAYVPNIFPRMYLGVGLGTVEEDHNNNLTGQVLWDVAQTVRSSDAPWVSYTPKTRALLFDE